MAIRKAKTPEGTEDAGPVKLLRLGKSYVDIEILGTTPVIPHAWSEKSRRLMPGHPDKSISEKKAPHDPETEAEACQYRLPDGRPGIPATAFKAAMCYVYFLYDGVVQKQLKMLLYVRGEGPEQYVPIEGTAVLHEDTPRNANGSADLRYRYWYEDWRAVVRVEYYPSAITLESIVSLLDTAGSAGVCDWRPSAPKSLTGTYGQWQVTGVTGSGKVEQVWHGLDIVEGQRA